MQAILFSRLSLPTTFHKRLVSKNVVGGDVSSRLERYGQSVIDRENAIPSRWKETGSRGKSVGDVKLGNHATYQGPYLQLVQDDSLLNISETLTFP